MKKELKAAHDIDIQELQMQHQSELAEAEQHLSDFVDVFEKMKQDRDISEEAVFEAERVRDQLKNVCIALDAERSMYEAALAAALKVIDEQAKFSPCLCSSTQSNESHCVLQNTD